MATYLLVTLFLTADPAIDREAAFKAARGKYDVMILAAAKAHFEGDIKSKKNAIAWNKRAAIVPAVPGPTLFEGELQFPDAESKRKSVAEAVQNLAKVEADFELWKNGAIKVSPQLPDLQFGKLAVGQVGQLGIVEMVSELDGGDTLARMMSSQTGRPETTPVVIVGRSTRFDRVFWVSGKRTIGKQSVFVIEPLFAD